MSLDDDKKSVAPPSRLEFLPPETLDPELYERLLEIRHAFDQVLQGFPHNYCTRATAFVASQTPLLHVGGKYLNPPAHTLPETHHWNKTSDGRLIVDLTYDQFVPSAPPITILPAGTPGFYELPHVQRLISGYELPPEFLEQVNAILRKK